MKAVVNAKPRNAGERSSSTKDRPIAARLAGAGSRWVSSRRAAVRTSTAAPSAPRSAKSARQPTHSARYAPIAGDIEGARLIAIMIVAMALAERSRSNRSRTIARPSTMPGAPAAGLDHAADDQHRQRPGEPANHRPGEEQGEPGDQHRAPPEAIGDGTIDQLPDGDAGEKQRQYQLDRCRRGLRIPRPAAAATAPACAAPPARSRPPRPAGRGVPGGS